MINKRFYEYEWMLDHDIMMCPDVLPKWGACVEANRPNNCKQSLFVLRQLELGDGKHDEA